MDISWLKRGKHVLTYWKNCIETREKLGRNQERF